MPAKNKVFLVDSDPAYLRALATHLAGNALYNIETYGSAELCLKNLGLRPGVVILDYRIEGQSDEQMKGMQLLDEIKKNFPEISVVVTSSTDSITVALDCLTHQAHDHVVKSETAFLRLEKMIRDLLNHQKLERALSWYMSKL